MIGHRIEYNGVATINLSIPPPGAISIYGCLHTRCSTSTSSYETLEFDPLIGISNSMISSDIWH